ncbi:glycosyltransferase [Bosea sp. PAMC 26642]|uniref:glycosyltransferase n=1 Tax=Bosea sp. (strain PAMC 26642) TaxID=1792307 RepID=UPI00077020FD|nr:glycosyltransferase [Bosea sp. PAMC 26642]AMJ60268.1 glycosyltransferase [Bosea sp. PAMC 26642]
MTRPIGYYVHHHGDGHRRRALSIARAAPGCFTLIGTGLAGRTDGITCLDLPDDRPVGNATFDGADCAGRRPHALHYAPFDHDGVRQRVALLASWIARTRPALMVVDVSVEIAMLARLAATPTVYVRLGGARDDAAHLEAFRGAHAMMAPFHRDLDEPSTVEWVRTRTRFCPGLTIAKPAPAKLEPDTVLVVYGMGGPGGSGDDLAEAARAVPALQWRAIGPVSQPREQPRNLELPGWIEDADAEIAKAGVVIGGAGDGLVNAVIAAGRPFICLPQSRPFDEQGSKAGRLEALGAAIVLARWPQATAWPGLIAAAEALRPEALSRLHDPDGPRKAAQFLIATAKGGTAHAND